MRHKTICQWQAEPGAQGQQGIPQAQTVDTVEDSYLLDEDCTKIFPGNKVMLHQLCEGFQGVSQHLPCTGGIDEQMQ